MKTTWKIGRSHVESDAQIVPEIADHSIEWLDRPLALLPLSITKGGGGTNWMPLGPEGMRVKLTVSTEFYLEHVDGHRKLYAWMSTQAGDDVLQQWCNQFLVTRRQDRAGEDAVSFYMESIYRKNFTTVDELLESQEPRPAGDFVNRNCGCRGKQAGVRDWLRRVFRKSPYVYAISVADGTETTQIDGVRVRPPHLLVTRVTREGRLDWQCSCGAWTEIAPHDRGREDMTLLGFRDSRSAHDYMRRLRNGVPQNWELIVAASSIVSGIAFILGEIVIPLLSSAE